MPFTDAVSSMSGRNSRASNVSGMTGASHSVRSGPPPVPKANDMFANAGVLSMLKTTTDIGDIGSLPFNHGRLPTVPRQSHQRRSHAARPSTSSDLPRPGGSSHHYPTGNSSHHHYAPSQNSRLSDSNSFARRGSLTSMQSMPPSLPMGNSTGKGSLQMPAPTFNRTRDSRSYSMNSALATGQLPRLRSATSLKSAGHEPRHGPRLHSGDVPPLPENRPPYVYPTRLKRPGYRSPSPALSEMSGHGYPMPHGMQMAPGNMQPLPMQRPQVQTYNSDYGPSYAPDAQYLGVRPSPRTMNVCPIMDYEQPQFAYRPEATRSDPGVHLPPMPHPRQQGHMHHGPPPPARSGCPGQHYGPPRPRYAQYAPMQQHPAYAHPGYRGPPPQGDVNPMAHSMFQNAARMARHLPQRTDTPITDMGPPSSEPPSSGTAPTSSNPPTPRDQTSIHVAVDPLFIDPALTDLPDSSSEPVLSAKYFAYADGLDKGIDEQDTEVSHPSVPPTGFVQRVRAMLESRAAVEAAAKRDAERDTAAATAYPGHQLSLQQMQDIEYDVSAMHEMAANETPRFTTIEEFEAPVGLPASPVKLPELPNSPAKPKQRQRLTRELVKAELAGSSTVQDSSTEAVVTETIGIEIEVELGRNGSKQTLSSENTAESNDSADTPQTRGKTSTPGSAITASPEAISGMDYALRFSVPVDTTTATDETQSRDPFMLDADTITLQHQRSKEGAPTQLRNEMGETMNPPSRLSEIPVSPLQPGEDVSRCSAVSPLRTHTIGIDETLRLRASTDCGGSSEYDQSKLDAAPSAQEQLPPPTPRTPRIYSKSVQLPHASVTTTGTPTSNRFSLPPDLSTVADITMNTNSDMITDVAVRFSLPNTTITIGKPQIITIPPSSSPDKPDSPPPKSKFRSLEPRSAHRSSVTFADQIAPLNIKKPEPRYETYSHHEPATSRGKSIMRRPTPIEESNDSSRGSRDSTAELRFANGNGFNGRFGSTHLPGLKEESIDNMSISDHQKRSSSRTDSQQLTLPARIAAVKAMQERRLQESAEKSRARRGARHHNHTLAEIRDLPSLNFSRMDLIDKLNQALEIRPTKSMEVVRRRDFSAIYCPSPQRPQSTEPLRDRYTSFFSKPEDFSIFNELGVEDADEGPGIPTVEVQESTRIEGLEESGNRPLSPEYMLNFATQVNRLSIPSVSGLSEKLTNWLPALKNLDLDSILANDEEVAHTIEDIRHLGCGGRPDTLLSCRTSAGFRTLAERADEIVRNGTHDSVLPGARLLSANKELPPLPESASADRVSALNSMDTKLSYLSGSVSAPTDLGMPIRPASALLRQKSPTTEEEVRQLLPPEMNPITRGKRPLVISSTSRPWNQDENYPWSGGAHVPMDLSIPSSAHTRDSVTGELTRTTGRSIDLSTSAEATETTEGIDIGSILTNADCASITTEQATGHSHPIPPQHHFRKHSKRSIMGSISQKISLASHGRRADDPHHRGGAVPSPIFLRSDDSLAHKPGDRYPTTGLTPPVNMNLDEVRSFFSDNSSEGKGPRHGHASGTSFRKRLTGFSKHPKHRGGDQHHQRAAVVSGRLDATAPTRGASIDGTMTYDAGSLNAMEGLHQHQRGGTSSRLGAVGSLDGVGMGLAEFRIKRFGERLRVLFARGGEMIRGLSLRGKGGRGGEREREGREDWLGDEAYEGV
ncbi:hypothetical protein LTR82_009767 [Friedmanniomyces endolithicus]|uniref:Uncharacterized protein n=1 Tax=Friedmanniomyces endolithicus TaxID=329885 RepID=A0AAN6J7L9_9PEZI|nr:hypothetical protein LTR82_009767 [Friedmanniomyces endolithicus]